MYVDPISTIFHSFQAVWGGHFVFYVYGHQGAGSPGLITFLKTLDPTLSPCKKLKFVYLRKYCGAQKDIPTQLIRELSIFVIMHRSAKQNIWLFVEYQFVDKFVSDHA